jgi:hypothetical protein
LLGEKKKERKKRKEKKYKRQGAFFPGAGHALLAVPHGIFMDVKCN